MPFFILHSRINFPSWASFFCQLVNPSNIFVIGYFLTRIFHPNIASNGEICVNTLKKDWNPSLGLRHVLTVSSIATVRVCFVYFHFHLLLVFIDIQSLVISGGEVFID